MVRWMLLIGDSVWEELLECGVDDTEREDRRWPGVERLVCLERVDEDEDVESELSKRVSDPSPDPRTWTLSGRLRLSGGGSDGKGGLV
jgi:hypothetical protein